MYCDFLQQIAAERKIPVTDLYTKMYKIASKLKHIKGNKLTIDNLHMNGYGNQMMAEGVLETLGIPAAKIQEYKKDWNKLPSMAPLLNHAHNPKYLISIEEYEILQKKAAEKKMDVHTFVWSILKNEIKNASSTKETQPRAAKGKAALDMVNSAEFADDPKKAPRSLVDELFGED